MASGPVINRFVLTTEIDAQQWDDFVYKHPQGNIFQTPAMYEVYRKTRNYQALKLFAVDRETGNLAGVLSAITVTEKAGLFRSFSTHAIIQGGPLVLPGWEDHLAPFLLREHDRLCQRSSLYSETRNLYDFRGELNSVTDYNFESYLDFLIDLDQPENDLWQQIHPSRRKNIREAEKQGIRIEELSEDQALPGFYGLLQETYRNARIPLADFSLFESAFRVLSPRQQVKFFIARQGKEYLAAQVILLHKDTIYAWYSGISLRARQQHLQANALIIWHILRWGQSQGYKTFDFMGAERPQVKYGPRDFKESFGGKLVDFGRHKKIYSPLKLKITGLGFSLYRRLFY